MPRMQTPSRSMSFQIGTETIPVTYSPSVTYGNITYTLHYDVTLAPLDALIAAAQNLRAACLAYQDAWTA